MTLGCSRKFGAAFTIAQHLDDPRHAIERARDQADARQHGEAGQARRRVGLLDAEIGAGLAHDSAAVSAQRPAAGENSRFPTPHARNVVADGLGRRRQIEGEIRHSSFGAHDFSRVD